MNDFDSRGVLLDIERLRLTREAAEGLRLFKAFTKLDSHRRSEILQMLEREVARLPASDA
jgi:hypothetical protein